MKIPCLLILLAIPLLTCVSSAQEINNLLSYKNINSESYFRLNYENDFFAATDEYYTQGISLEVVSAAMKKNPLTKLLIHPSYSYLRYGIGIEHNGYTPSDIGHNEVLYGDRPFAGALMLKSFAIAIDPDRHQRFSASLSTGVLGPFAGAGQMQRDIHKWLFNITPHGWDNQIQNDVIVNYEVDYEKQLLSYKNICSFDADACVRAGTLSDKANLGVTMMIGFFDAPYSSATSAKSNFRIYAYEHPEFCFVGYDATLEGGLFDRTSPYTISANNIDRIVFKNRFGFVIAWQGFNLEYFQSVMSREFETQKMHVWGGVQVAFRI